MVTDTEVHQALREDTALRVESDRQREYWRERALRAEDSLTAVQDSVARHQVHIERIQGQLRDKNERIKQATNPAVSARQRERIAGLEQARDAFRRAWEITSADARGFRDERDEARQTLASLRQALTVLGTGEAE